MQIQETIQQILSQLSYILSQLNDDEYSKEISLLDHQTIGKHARHIIEFFQELVDAENSICYDNRKRNLQLETSILFTLATIKKLNFEISKLDFEKEIELKQLINQEVFKTKTTIGREMIYCIDHGIHHFAIIKIALSENFPRIIVDNDFGVAYSTLKYHKK